jgi:conjugal transfer/type IV secretion protein DotA/TraY
MLAIMMVAGAVALIEPIVLGTGITQDPAEGVITAINTYFMPVFFLLLGILLFYGGLMAIYIPLIPFVIFTTSAIGWFISVVEALVAGPIVALGIMSPGGQHEFLGKAEGGAMMLFAVFLKPSLMIVGMFVGMLLSSTMVGMVNSFWGTITGSFSSGDPIGFFMLLGAKIMLTIAVISKCFSAIYVLPNQILTWMGGPAGHEQGGEALGEVKGGQEKVGSQVGGAAKQGQKASGVAAGVGQSGVDKGDEIAESKGRAKRKPAASVGEEKKKT